MRGTAEQQEMLDKRELLDEPTLQPLQRKHLKYKSANGEVGARLDAASQIFWGKDHQTAYFDVRIFNPFAHSYANSSISKCYRKHELNKKREYEERVREIEHGSFSPFIFSTARAPDGFDAVSVQNVGSTYIIVSWDLPTHSPPVTPTGTALQLETWCWASTVLLPRCEDDTRGWLYYLLAIYVPVFTFFMFIVVFNVCFTTGPLNAFILYAQLISTTFNQLYKPIDGYQRAYRTLPEVPGGRVPPLHDRRYRGVPQVGSGRVATSLVHAFAAFILLSYTRFCLVTTYVLTPIPLWNIAMETVEDRPYFAGQHRFSDLSYILPNVIPAFIVLVTFIAIPPILLLDYPMRWIESAIFKSPALTRWYPKVDIGIVLDAFQGCFHDDMRYFAGQYFTLRLLLIVTYFAPLILQYVLQQVLVTVFAVFLSVQRPYKMHSLNFLDSLLLLNMAVINILGIYSLATDQLTPIVVFRADVCLRHPVCPHMAAGRIRDGVPVSAIKDCKCIARSRGHFHLKEASAMELRGRTKLCDSAVEGRDRESEVEHSDTSTLYVLIDLDE
eukprot:Em0003g230a